jgi:aminopeptidase-like protein
VVVEDSKKATSIFAKEAFDLAKNLWPISRSITGSGFEESLRIIEEYLDFPIQRIRWKTGQEVFDWQIPKQWEVYEAFIRTPSGDTICNFKENNLHLVNYSIPFKGSMSLEQLKTKLYSDPSRPNAIPYVTSYYKEDWGFCLSENQKSGLKEGVYEVLIDTALSAGELVVGEVFLPGSESETEVLLSTYLCHPSMANNELSGPVVCAAILSKQKAISSRRGLRVLFLPETIGSIAYISKYQMRLKKNLIAGYVVTCVGDNRGISLIFSRKGDSLADKVAESYFEKKKSKVTVYPWGQRGSDERQYCWPGVDLPIASIMRSKYHTYYEYHSSLDTLGDVVTESGLEGSIEIYDEIVSELRNSFIPVANTLCEPNLGKIGLYPLLSGPDLGEKIMPRKILDVLSYSDRSNNISSISKMSGISESQVHEILLQMKNLGLVENA